MGMVRKCVVLLLLCWPACAAKVDLLVEGAEDSELQPLLAALAGKKEVRVGAWTFWTGKMGRKSVVVSRTGIGPANAVAATTIAIERFHPAAILNQGTAGAHDPSLAIWDIVIGTRTADYSGFTSPHADAGAGIDATKWKPFGEAMQSVLAGDAKLAAQAKAVPYARARVVAGTIGSAFEINREIDRIDWLRKTFGTDTEDMESAYVAATAKGMGIPFLAIRIVSDSEFTHPKYEEIAGQYCAEFVRDFIQRMK